VRFAAPRREGSSSVSFSSAEAEWVIPDALGKATVPASFHCVPHEIEIVAPSEIAAGSGASSHEATARRADANLVYDIFSIEVEFRGASSPKSQDAAAAFPAAVRRHGCFASEDLNMGERPL